DHVGRDRLHDLNVEVSSRQLELPLGGFDHHIGQDRDRIAALDDTLDVAQSLQKGPSFYVNFHGPCAWFQRLREVDSASPRAPRNPLFRLGDLEPFWGPRLNRCSISGGGKSEQDS